MEGLSIFKGQNSDGIVTDQSSEEVEGMQPIDFILVSRVRLERTTLALKGQTSAILSIVKRSEQV